MTLYAQIAEAEMAIENGEKGAQVCTNYIYDYVLQVQYFISYSYEYILEARSIM